MNCAPWMHKVFLITRTRATLAHISGQTGSVVLNWWLVAQQGRRPWVRWRGTALCHHHHHHHHYHQGWIFLVVKATMGWWMVEIGHSAIWTRFHGMINLSRGPWLSVIWNPLSMHLLHNTGYLLQLPRSASVSFRGFCSLPWMPLLIASTAWRRAMATTRVCVITRLFFFLLSYFLKCDVMNYLNWNLPLLRSSSISCDHTDKQRY